MAYFATCQREAASKRNAHHHYDTRGRDESELFHRQGAVGIKFSSYDKIDVEVKGPQGSETVPPLEGFSSLGSTLPPFLRENLRRMHYERPTPIQKHAVPYALDGRDLMCCAQTGSGKTFAFLFPVAAALGGATGKQPATVIGQPASPRCVVLAPTRELALQISLEAEKVTFDSPLRSVVVYGGADQKKQVRDLAFGCDIVVATPGRLNDFIERGIASMSAVSYLVLDEADRMLDMGFEPQIRRIVQQSDMPPKERRQTLLFSATFAPEVQKLAAAFLRPYVWIAVGRVGSTVENIEQRLVLAKADKREKLKLAAEALAECDGRTLVFVQKKRTATWLKHCLRRGGPGDAKPDEKFSPVEAEDIHGDRSQPQREAALAKFRAGTCRVLVATDVAARGLDIGGVEHVINFDLPVAASDFDSYVHRIGRTGRAGHQGLATSLYVPGFADKNGNGPIAPQLLRQMQETGSEVPEWFKNLPETYTGGAGSKHKFGGRDVRDGGGKRQEREAGGGGRGNGGSGRRRGGRGRGKGGG